MNLKPIIQCIAMLVLLAACDEASMPSFDEMMASQGIKKPAARKDTLGLSFGEPTFSDRYQLLEVPAKLVSDIGGYDLTDFSKVGVRTAGSIKYDGGEMPEDDPPLFLQVDYKAREQLKHHKVRLLVMVDLSLPQPEVDAQQRAVEEMLSVFSSSNVSLAFMMGEHVSETYNATPYIVSNYFRHADPDYTYLHRSVLAKLDEMADSSSVMASGRYKVMVIFSGGKTYVGDNPIDPEYFNYQQALADRALALGKTTSVYYASFGDSLTIDDQNNANVFQLLCQKSHGLYQDKLRWSDMLHSMARNFDIGLSDYHFSFDVPDGKVFRGQRHSLLVEYYDLVSDKSIVSGRVTYKLGSLYRPVIVNDDPVLTSVIEGLVVTLLILLAVYLVFQFLIPYIRYRLFCSKYVIAYTGRQMSVDGHEVAESCYLCKAPFIEGDQIVTKCRHTMHKACWDENEYHCPEHGRHCKEGSHYYNRRNLFDSRNASFYMRWTLAAIIAGAMSWLMFTLHTNWVITPLVQQIAIWLFSLEPGTPATTEFLSHSAVYINNLPAYGFYLSFFLTFCLSHFTVRRREWFHHVFEMFARAFLAGVLGASCFLLACIIFISLEMEQNSLLIDWIPWGLMTVVILLCITLFTRIRLRKLFVLGAFLLGLLSLYAWPTHVHTVFNYHVEMLLHFILYAVVVALCIAVAAPKSERYFLHVEGAIKDLDIALYKWYRSTPDNVVTIGRSVDCSIQLSWDINSSVAPLQAEIRRSFGELKLYALEEGVTAAGRPLPVGRAWPLYHGRRFTIGKTTFTYVEKDV